MPARFTSSPGIPVTKKEMLVHWNLHFLFCYRENQVYSERSSLNAWLIQYPLPSAGASYAMFLSIHTIIYKQTFRKTGRRGTLSMKLHSLPVFMSICSEIVVIIGWKNCQSDEPAKRRNCVSHALRLERSEKHLFWMLGEWKWEFQ